MNFSYMLRPRSLRDHRQQKSIERLSAMVTRVTLLLCLLCLLNATIVKSAFSQNFTSLPPQIRLLHADSNSERKSPARSLIKQGTDTDPDGEPNGGLYVALLTPQDGADTSASGIATVRVDNDGQTALINMSFSGLSSPQIAAHVHEVSTDNVVQSIPIGQATNFEWLLEDSGLLADGGAVADALNAGLLYINIHSREFPDGEIQATLLPTNGSIRMIDPASPEPFETLSETDLRRDIYRFLTQATFGPTPENVADLEALVKVKDGDRIAAYEEWLDDQMTLESPSLLAFYSASRQMYAETDPAAGQKIVYLPIGLSEGWFTGAVYGKAQLRERIAFALSEIFVISIDDDGLRRGAMGTASYYDMLRANAFTSFETLLTDVSKHPAMGWYLSHFQNQAELRNENGDILTSPDENYAREVMQLFSIGLLQLHPNGTLKLDEGGLPIRTYDQSDITELSRVLTGWGMSVRNPEFGNTDEVVPNEQFYFTSHVALKPYHPYWSQPMKMFEDNGLPPTNERYIRFHDDGMKKVLGKTIPAGLEGEEDLARVMTLLSTHPNTAPFIAYRLIQRLVVSNPTPDYVYRVATVFEESEGDLGAVIKAILLDPEVRNFNYHSRSGYGKQKEPLVHFTSLLRLINASSSAADDYPLEKLSEYGLPEEELALYGPNADILFISTALLENENVGFRQSPLQAPTVFNWFQTDYAPPGLISSAALVSPESQLGTENQVIQFYNTLYLLLLTDGLLAGQPQALLDRARTTYEIPEWLIDAYTKVIDSNKDGELTKADSAFDEPGSVVSATSVTVEMLDLYLCGGKLSANATGDLKSDPYTILIDGLVRAVDHWDHKTQIKAEKARSARLRDALYLIGSAPDCLLQQ